MTTTDLVQKPHPRLVSAMLNPQIYPDAPAKVELVETYISYIFLAGDYVYKIKKPVNYGYLDFTTLEKRRVFCFREMELNRRLCPSIYLGVVPIIKDKDGMALWMPDKGESEVVEYAVKMRRLPQDRMLDVLLSKKQVTSEMMVVVARKLAEFHKKAETSVEIGSYGHPDGVRMNTVENLEQTRKYVGVTIPGNVYIEIWNYTESFLKDNRNLFYKRVQNGRIRDCHGDAHAQHICFYEGVQIFDCIEFNDKFRYGDVASEVAFLAMDLEFNGRYDLFKAFVDAYVDFSGDKELLRLLNFYKVYRAYVRGKVSCFRLDDPNIPQDERDVVLERAKEYFRFAESYAK